LVNYAKSLIFIEKTGKKKLKRDENCAFKHPAKDFHVKNMGYASFSECTGYIYVWCHCSSVNWVPFPCV